MTTAVLVSIIAGGSCLVAGSAAAQEAPAVDTPATGGLEGCDDDECWGYAFDPDFAGSTFIRLYVDSELGGPTEPVADVVADLPSPGKGPIGTHGFRVKHGITDTVAHTIRAYARGKDAAGDDSRDNPELPGSPLNLTRPVAPPPQTADAPAGGVLEGCDDSECFGYAFDPDFAGSTFIRLYVDSELGGPTEPVADVVAELPSPGKGPIGTHGFRVKHGITDTAAHTIRAYVRGKDFAGGDTGANPELSGSPRPLTLPTVPPPGTLGNASKQLNSIHVIHYNVNGSWVKCGLVAFDKEDEVQDFLAKIGIQDPGLYTMTAEQSAKMDAIVLSQTDAASTDQLFKPLYEAVQAAAAGPVDAVVPVRITGDANEGFRATCLRRS